MKFLSFSPFALSFILLLAVLSAAPEWQVKDLAPSDRIVKNPHAGFLFMPRPRPPYETADKVPDWILEVSSIAYFRLAWDVFVNEKGEYDFDRVDAQYFASYRQRGLRLALRIMPGNRFSPTPCIFPREKLGKDIPFIKVDLGTGKVFEMPTFWHEAYIREHGRLMQALGAWVDKHPEVDHVDFGGMGEWGEMHFVGWTLAQKQEQGLTEEKYLDAVWRMMAQMERWLPSTPKAVCISPFGGITDDPTPIFKLIADRATRRGWWLRTDAHDVKGAKPDLAPFFSRSLCRPPWIIEPAGDINRDYYGAPCPISNYFDAVMRYKPHVINLMGIHGLGSLKPDEQDYLTQLAKKIGYRLQVAKAVMPKLVDLPPGEAPAISLSLTVAQNGAVPYLGEAIYQLRFNQDGKVVWQTAAVPQEPLSTLFPGKRRSERLFITLPTNLAAKPTRVSLALRDLETGLLRPDNAEVDGEYVPLGEIRFRKDAPSAAVDLLPRLAGARLPPGIEVEKSGAGFVLKGRDEKSWSYASLAGMPLQPDCVYVMKLSVRAWKTPIADSRLAFKIGVRTIGETAERNINTQRYDFDQEGTWQELTLRYLSKAGEEIGQFAVEKQRTAPSTVNAEFRSWTLETRTQAPLE